MVRGMITEHDKTDPIYCICRRIDWDAAAAAGAYGGSDNDRADGFIHFSAHDQVVISAARHRTGQSGLVMLAVDPVKLGVALKWESSRGGKLFPHLYSDLAVDAVLEVHDLPLGDDGLHCFPDGFEAGS